MSMSAVRPAVWPAALLPCVRMLWGRVLFASRAPVDTNLRAKSLALLVVLPAVLSYPWMAFRLLEPDEGRYAEIAREMLAANEWVVPLLQGEAYLDKPPLLYWLVVASYKLFGVHVWAARLVPALAVHATILATYLLGRRFVGERAAFRGALLLCATPAFAVMGRLLILDGLLAVWVTLGILAKPTRGNGGMWWLCAIACGLGVLTKGPVAIVLVVPPILLHRWLSGESLHVADFGWRFVAVVLALNLPWYVAVWWQHPEFGAYFFLKHNAARFLAPFDHLEPVWYYIPVVVGGLFPGTLLLWGFVRRILSGDAASADWRTPGLAYMLTAGVWCVAFFSLSGSKLPTYVLPAFPVLCLALGYSVVPTTLHRWAFWSWFALVLTVNAVVLPWYAWQRSPLGPPETVVRELCGDPKVPVCAYPRNVDSVAFYLGRDDVRPTRSKFAHLLVADLRERPRTVVLFTHRHSLEAFKFALPPDLRVTREVSFRRRLPGPAWLTAVVGDTPWGLCDIAVIERADPTRPH